MGGFVCRFCNCDAGGDNGSMSLEISIRNRKIIVYVCLDCYAHLAESVIVRCQYCGNIWLQKEVRIGRGLRSTPHCYLKALSDAKASDMDMLLSIITPFYKGFLIGLFLGAFTGLALLGLRMVVKERGQNERCHGAMKIREY